ncbi:MAG: large conductance mechanosensitive channel protein MscL [Flavitalea sp.]
MKILQDFKAFALKGNVLDLAVGIIIGAAFAAIITAVVDNILMPIIGILTGGVDFKSLAVKVGDAELKYGMFIQATITFIIIAFFLFLIVKAANKMKEKEPAAPAAPSSTDKILLEVHQELKNIREELRSK